MKKFYNLGARIHEFLDLTHATRIAKTNFSHFPLSCCIFLYATLLKCIQLYESSYKHVFIRRVENCEDLDQLAFEKPADLDLHCFHFRIYYICF